MALPQNWSDPRLQEAPCCGKIRPELDPLPLLRIDQLFRALDLVEDVLSPSPTTTEHEVSIQELRAS